MATFEMTLDQFFAVYPQIGKIGRDILESQLLSIYVTKTEEEWVQLFNEIMNSPA